MIEDRMDEMPKLNMECIKCGYNLHGLKSDGVCPECGLSVAESLKGDESILPWRRRKACIGITSAAFALLHFIFGAIALSSDNTEGAGFLIVVVDFPVVMVATLLGGAQSIFGSTAYFAFLVLVGGTAFYAIIGMILGYIMSR